MEEFKFVDFPRICTGWSRKKYYWKQSILLLSIVISVNHPVIRY